MRVGLTGSSGLIGTALASALAERGDELITFVRPGAQAPGATVRWDPTRGLLDDGDLARAGTLDAVVHLAGAGIADRRWSKARKEEILRSRVDSTTLLVSALADRPPAIFASGSAIGYYGSRGDETLDETSSAGHDFLAQVCREWEASAVPLAERGAVVTRLRTGIVMSSRGGALAKQLPLFRWGLGGRLASGRQWVSPISLVDEVRAILWTLDHRIGGPVNLVCPTPLTNRDFTRALAGHLRRPALATVPAVALKIALGAQLATDAVLASQRVLPGVLTKNGFSFAQPDIRSILAAVDHENQ